MTDENGRYMFELHMAELSRWNYRKADQLINKIDEIFRNELLKRLRIGP